MKKKSTYLYVMILIAACGATFGRIAKNSFVNYDDDRMLYDLINFHSIQSAFTTVGQGHWQPLSMISHMLDWSLFGANASGHHLVSLLLHSGAVIFLFLFLHKTTHRIWPALFAAAFFALHPLRVESVAWAATRGDVLSMFFGMSCLYTYVLYSERKKLSHYLLCLTLFVFALTSKAIMITLPFVFFLIDYWPLRRYRAVSSEPVESDYKIAGRLIWEKMPFICVTIVSCMITIWAKSFDSGLVKFESLPFTERLSHSFYSYIAYLGKIFWPVDLAVYYPYDYLSVSLWNVLISAIIIIWMTVVVLYYRKKSPYLFVGWFWYLGTLFPFVGLMQASSQAMADRYAYFPSIGIALILAYGMPSLIQSTVLRKKVLLPAGVLFLTIVALLSYHQCGYWKTTFELWNHAIKVTKNNYLAYQYRGIAYGQTGQYRLAIDDFNKALNVNKYYKGYNNRGFAYANLGLYQQAIEDYNEAIHLQPDYVKAYYNRGHAYLSQHNRDLGCRDAQKACELGNCALLEWAGKEGLCR
jgi:protein O-mannosyl-transferase